MVYPIGKLIWPPIYCLWLKDIKGKENMPKDTPFIVAANHSSYYDTLLPYIIITKQLNKQVHALVNSRYWDSLFFRAMMEWGKCIPVYVEKAIKSEKKNKKSLKKAISFLKEGHIIQIFPEGRRSPDGRLQKAYTGVAKLALEAKVPVLPFGIIGSSKVIPKGKIIPRFARASVMLGKPLYFNKYYGKGKNKKILETMTREIMMEIGSLTGQRYAH